MVGPTDISIHTYHHISKLRRYFWFFFEVSKFQHFINLFLTFKSDLLMKRVFFLLNATFAVTIVDLISHVHLVLLLPGYPDSWNIAHSPFKFFVNLRSLKLTEFQTRNFKSVKNMYAPIKPLKRAPKLSLREWKRNEKKEAEEYCWAIIQAAGRSYRGRSGSSVLEFGFLLDSVVFTYLYVYVYIYIYIYIQGVSRL